MGPWSSVDHMQRSRICLAKYQIRETKVNKEVLTEPDDDVLRILSRVVEIVLKNALGTIRIPRLGIQSGTRIMRHHTITTTQWVLDGTPDMVLGCGLDVPNISRVTRDLARLECGRDVVLVADGTTCGVDEPCTFFEVLEEVSVDKAASALVQWAVDGHDVAL